MFIGHEGATDFLLDNLIILFLSGPQSSHTLRMTHYMNHFSISPFCGEKTEERVT